MFRRNVLPLSSGARKARNQLKKATSWALSEIHGSESLKSNIMNFCSSLKTMNPYQGVWKWIIHRVCSTNDSRVTSICMRPDRFWGPPGLLVNAYLSIVTQTKSGRKVTISIPDEVIAFLNWPNPSSRTMALGSTQPLTEMSIRNLPGGKGSPADNLTVIW
jgi:hypothetical protein